MKFVRIKFIGVPVLAKIRQKKRTLYMKPFSFGIPFLQTKFVSFSVVPGNHLHLKERGLQQASKQAVAYCWHSPAWLFLA
jgi:hypothetical protein